MTIRQSTARICALLIFAWLSVTAAWAQTISVTDTSSGAFGSAVIGQSFTATLTGTVTSINVQSNNSTTSTLLMYNGASGSGLTTIGTPAYIQPGVTLTAAGEGVWQTINLTTPFPVVAGASYTFLLDGGIADISLYGNSNAYAGGTFVGGDYGRVLAFLDLAFQIFEVVPAPASVPTLSEWALLLLAGGLALVGYRALRRRRV